MAQKEHQGGGHPDFFEKLENTLLRSKRVGIDPTTLYLPESGCISLSNAHLGLH